MLGWVSETTTQITPGDQYVKEVSFSDYKF